MQSTSFSISDALAHLHIKSLNAMQQASLEANASHDAVVLLADTGSGKTLAFLLPVAQLLNINAAVCQALIVVSSRELAIQIEQVFKSMGTGCKITCCYGGHKREIEENNLKQAPSLIVGTPGRLADHIRRGNIDTSHIETLVLDEFDKSLEQGFETEMAFIIQSLTALKKRILTSATQALEIPEFIGLKNPVEINFLSGKKSEALAVQMIRCADADKLSALFNLICTLGNRSTIVFCNQREFVEQVSQFLKNKGITNVFYHGAMEQDARDIA
ncbi:MAG: DEAD/DEAH box helicase, partial [Sediminibacterium sp.]|nr:DEAD/DEAH box helicase [Sediminibacterium sp.]